MKYNNYKILRRELIENDDLGILITIFNVNDRNKNIDTDFISMDVLYHNIDINIDIMVNKYHPSVISAVESDGSLIMNYNIFQKYFLDKYDVFEHINSNGEKR